MTRAAASAAEQHRLRMRAQISVEKPIESLN
jgi:hypothetical protein